MQYFSFRDVLFYEVAFTVPLDLSTDAMTVVMCSSLGVFSHWGFPCRSKAYAKDVSTLSSISESALLLLLYETDGEM